MPKVELEYRCGKSSGEYPALITYTGKMEDPETEDSQSRCPFCGECNCADPPSVERAVREKGKV